MNEVSAIHPHQTEAFAVTANAMIIYQESDLARKASAHLRQASHRAGNATEWKIKPWRMEFLHRPPLATEAFQDATEAHLLMFAIYPQAEFSIRFLRWLETWATQRRVKDAALAVLDDGPDDPGPGTVAQALREFAQRNRLCFISGRVARPQTESAMLWNDLHNREVAQTPTLRGILEQSSWGEP